MVNQVTIRVVNKLSGKVKFVFPMIANNKQLMKTSGMEISDPQYDAKMEAFKNNRPFIENGKSKEPVKESFVSTEVLTSTQTIEPPKNFCKTIDNCCSDSNMGTLGSSYTIDIKPEDTVITYRKDTEDTREDIKPKRTRRTKEQMKQSKLQK